MHPVVVVIFILGDGTSSGNANIQGQLVYVHNDNSMRFYTAVAERFRITSSGSFGFNTPSPGNTLVVKAQSGSDKGIELAHANGYKVAELVHHGSGSEGRLSLYDDGTETVRLHGESGQHTFINSGNVGIGTSSPAVKFHVNGTNASIGVLGTPKADWYTTAYNGLQVADGLTLWGRAGDAHMSGNYYVKDVSGVAKDSYINTGYAHDLWFDNGSGDLKYRNAASGSANGEITSFPTRLVIKNSGDVLIGSTTNLDVLSGTPKLQIGSGTGHASLQFYSGATSVNGIYFGDTSSANNNRYDGYIEYRHNDSSMAFRAGAASVLTLFSTVVASEIDVSIKNGKKLEFQTTAGSARGFISAQETNTGGTHSAGLIIATSGGEQITFKDSGIGGTTNLTIKNGELLVPATTTHQSITPHSYIYGGNTGTYNKTVTYLHQNNTSNSANNGMFIELGRLTDSSTAEIRHFIVGARGGQHLLKVDGLGNLKTTGKIEVGTFPQSQSNTGEAWLGRAADRQDGTLTVQLGGNDATGTRFEIVDRAWSKVIAQISGEAPSDSLWVSSSGNTQFGYHAYNSSSGISMIGPTGRTFWDINYNSYGAEILLVNNRTANGVSALLQYRTNSVVEGTLQASGTGLVISNVSDYRKKENIRDLTGSLSVIKSLQPRVYEYREGFGTEGDHIGFIAHEIQAHIPKAVTGDKDDLYTQTDIDGGATEVVIGEPKYQAVSYTHNEIITRLVQSIQELEARIAVLEGE